MAQAADGVGPGDGAANMGWRRWYALAVLTGSQAFYSLDRTVTSVVMEPIKTEFHLTDGQLGLVAGLFYGVSFAIAAIPFGLMADRVNRRNLLAGVLAAWSLLTSICGLAQSYAALALARMAVGAAEAGGTPTTLSIMSDLFHPKQRSTAIAIWYMGGPVGVTITFLAGGFIAQTYGWRSAFFLAGVPGLILALVVLMTIREPRRGAVDPVAAAHTAPAIREVAAFVARRPTIIHLITAMVLCAMTTSATSAWLISFLVRERGLPQAQSGIIGAVALGLFGATGGFLAGLIADRLGQGKDGKARPHRLALVATTTTFVAALAGAAALQATVLPAALGLLFTFALFNNAWNGPANSLLLTALPSRMRGLVVSGFQVLANLVGWGVGPYLVGLLSDMIGGPGSLGAALTIVLMINLWSSLHFWLASRAAQRDVVVEAIAVQA